MGTVDCAGANGGIELAEVADRRAGAGAAALSGAPGVVSAADFVSEAHALANGGSQHSVELHSVMDTPSVSAPAAAAPAQPVHRLQQHPLQVGAAHLPQLPILHAHLRVCAPRKSWVC